MEKDYDHSAHLAKAWVEDLRSSIDASVEWIEERIAHSVRCHIDRAEKADAELKLAREEIASLKRAAEEDPGKTGSEEG